MALGGYFPTPTDLLAPMAARLRAPSPQTFMDPCAGDGDAVARLAVALAPRLTPAQTTRRDAAQRGTLRNDNPDGPQPTPEECLAAARLWGIGDCAFACMELEAGRAARLKQRLADAGAVFSNVVMQEGDAFAVRFGL